MGGSQPQFQALLAPEDLKRCAWHAARPRRSLGVAKLLRLSSQRLCLRLEGHFCVGTRPFGAKLKPKSIKIKLNPKQRSLYSLISEHFIPFGPSLAGVGLQLEQRLKELEPVAPATRRAWLAWVQRLRRAQLGQKLMATLGRALRRGELQELRRCFRAWRRGWIIVTCRSLRRSI